MPRIQRRAGNAEALQIAFLGLIVSFMLGPFQKEELPYIKSLVSFPTGENNSLACCVKAKIGAVTPPLLASARLADTHSIPSVIFIFFRDSFFIIGLFEVLFLTWISANREVPLH